MTNQKKFEHSVNVLLKAFLNNTLEHGSCHACAIGNLLKTNWWLRFFVTENERNINFRQLKHKEGYFIYKSIGNGATNPFMYKPISEASEEVIKQIKEAKCAIDNSGYSITELQMIEFAFETANKGKSNDDYMFNGLMAVVDVLAEIHQIDLTTVKETKELFV